MQRLEAGGRVERRVEARVVLGRARHAAQAHNLDRLDDGHRDVRRGSVDEAHWRHALRRGVVAAHVHQVRQCVGDACLQRSEVVALHRGQRVQLIVRRRLVLGDVVGDERRRKHHCLHRDKHVGRLRRTRSGKQLVDRRLERGEVRVCYRAAVRHVAPFVEARLRPPRRRRLRHTQLGLGTLKAPLVRRHLRVQVADNRHVRLLVCCHGIVACAQAAQLVQQRRDLAAQLLHHHLLLLCIALHRVNLTLPVRLVLRTRTARRLRRVQLVELQPQRIQVRLVLPQLRVRRLQLVQMLVVRAPQRLCLCHRGAQLSRVLAPQPLQLARVRRQRQLELTRVRRPRRLELVRMRRARRLELACVRLALARMCALELARVQRVRLELVRVCVAVAAARGLELLHALLELADERLALRHEALCVAEALLQLQCMVLVHRRLLARTRVQRLLLLELLDAALQRCDALLVHGAHLLHLVCGARLQRRRRSAQRRINVRGRLARDRRVAVACLTVCVRRTRAFFDGRAPGGHKHLRARELLRLGHRGGELALRLGRLLALCLGGLVRRVRRDRRARRGARERLARVDRRGRGARHRRRGGLCPGARDRAACRKDILNRLGPQLGGQLWKAAF